MDLSDIYGADACYNPATSFALPGWLQGNRPFRDFRTGDHLAIAGNVRYVCSRSVMEGADLLEEAGFELPDTLGYDSREAYGRLLAGIKGPVVFQHAHAPGEVPPDRYWIARDLLCYLNNKANLGALVPPGFAPRRRVAPPVGFLPRALPVVLKAATDESTGGGRDVRICRTPAEVAEALRVFDRCDAIVVEEFLPIDASFCVQFATVGREIRYLGFAEQVTTPEGRFDGSWLDAEASLPDAVVAAGRAIMEAGVARGYRGIAGFDVARCADGRWLYFDLNFRLNGSTAPVLLLRATAARLQLPVFRYRSWCGADGFDALLARARRGLHAGRLLPLSIHAGAPPRLSGMVAGTSRADVEQNEHSFGHDALVRVRTDPQRR